MLQDGPQLVSIRTKKVSNPAPFKRNSPSKNNIQNGFYIVPHTDTDSDNRKLPSVKGQPELHQFVSSYLDFSKKSAKQEKKKERISNNVSPHVSSGFNSSDLPTESLKFD